MPVGDSHHSVDPTLLSMARSHSLRMEKLKSYIIWVSKLNEWKRLCWIALKGTIASHSQKLKAKLERRPKLVWMGRKATIIWWSTTTTGERRCYTAQWTTWLIRRLEGATSSTRIVRWTATLMKTNSTSSSRWIGETQNWTRMLRLRSATRMMCMALGGRVESQIWRYKR